MLNLVLLVFWLVSLVSMVVFLLRIMQITYVYKGFFFKESRAFINVIF